MMEGLPERSVGNPTTMSGALEEVLLPDLLQLFSTNKKTGSLAIDGPQSALIILKEGNLLRKTIFWISAFAGGVWVRRQNATP